MLSTTSSWGSGLPDCLGPLDYLAGPCSIPSQGDVLGRSDSGSFHAFGGDVRLLDWVREYSGGRSGLGHHHWHYLSCAFRSFDHIFVAAQKTDLHHWVFPLDSRNLSQAASLDSHLGAYLHRYHFPFWVHTQLLIFGLYLYRHPHFQCQQCVLQSLQ